MYIDQVYIGPSIKPCLENYIVIHKQTHDCVKVVSNQASMKERQVGNMTSCYKDKYVMRVKGDNEHYVNRGKIRKI